MAGAVSLVACDSPQQAGQRQKVPDPLSPFYLDTAALLGRYEATITAQSGLAARLEPLRDAHRAHLQALAREIGPGLDGSSTAGSSTAGPSTAGPSTAGPSTAGPSSTTAPSDGGAPSDGQPATLATLLASEKAATAAARAVCLRAPSYRAALLGSIAAARASHVAVLS